MAVAEIAAVASQDHGEVFTRRWVVELILDLAGYLPERDLASQVIVEPSCGVGAFLGPIVERLIASAALHGHSLEDLGPAVRAFDLLDMNAERARCVVTRQLCLAGLGEEQARAHAAQWVRTADFLLHGHAPASADYVVGNPPYIRLESMPQPTVDAYRRACPTMRGRADIYIGFIEKGLDLLKPGAALSFICADRWMRNQYGADLRELITEGHAVEAVISMHDADAFEREVSAYPAIIVLRNQRQGRAIVVEANQTFGARDARRLSTWVRRGARRTLVAKGCEAKRVDGWFSGRDLWPAASPSELLLIDDLEARFPPLEDPLTGTRVGIGVATGCDQVFITSDPHLVEKERLLPLLQAADTTSGTVEWSRKYLVNPWNRKGLVDLARYPRLATYLTDHEERLRGRHVARKRPASWYRTIDRVDPDLAGRPKLVLPDIKAAAHPVLDHGGHYPHHNLYYVVSQSWDLEVLGGLLLSDIANLFVGSYCVKMRGGTYRFQAQYLRRIRVPRLDSLTSADRRSLAAAFGARDTERATHVAARLYGLAGSIPARARSLVR